MWQNAHDSYLESRVLSADPIELIRLLYQSASRGVENARRHLANGDIAARARSISHASSVLIELAASLDHERGGKISANLAQLYDYMLRRLTEANLRQTDAPLAEVLGLLTTLSEAWDGLKAQGVTAPETRPDPVPPSASRPAAAETKPPQQSDSDSPATYGNSWAQPSSPPPSYQEAASSYGSSWEQPVPQGAAATYGSSWEQPSSSAPESNFSWEQPKSQDSVPSFGSSWEQPKSQDATAAFEFVAPNSRPSAPSAWSPDASPWTPAAAVQELAAAYGYSWAQSSAPEPAATFGSGDSPAPSPWEPPPAEPAANYGASWAHLTPEPAGNYSSHDWSL